MLWVYAFGLSRIVRWVNCRISWMMACTWSALSSGINTMETACSSIICWICMSKLDVSRATGLASPDNFLNAMHPTFSGYSCMLMMIHVSSELASIAFGITTLTRNSGVIWIVLCRSFLLFSLTDRTLQRMRWKSSGKRSFRDFGTDHFFFLEFFFRAYGI